MLHLVPYYRNDLAESNRAFSNMMDNFFRTGFDRMSDSAFKMDVEKKDDAYVVTADMPGVKKDDVSIHLEDDYLTITVDQKDEKEEKGEEKNYVYKERCEMNASRQIYLQGVDQNAIKAKMNDGVLEVTLPFAKEVSNKKKIEIE